MKLRTAGTLFMLMLALAACKQPRVTDMQEFSIAEPFEKLVVISNVGDIKIRNGADNATGVVVSAEKFADGCTKDQAQQYLDQIEVTYTVENTICTITVQLPENMPHTVYGGANLTIDGVQGLAFEIDLNVGSIEIDNMTGGSATTNVGDITVAGASSDIELETDTGDIKVTNYSGRKCSLRTDVGNADIGIHITGNSSLDGAIKTGIGNINCWIILPAPSARFELKTGVGTIEIESIGDFTHTGFISEQAFFELGAADGKFAMETGTGDISVGMFALYY